MTDLEGICDVQFSSELEWTSGQLDSTPNQPKLNDCLKIQLVFLTCLFIMHTTKTCADKLEQRYVKSLNPSPVEAGLWSSR